MATYRRKEGSDVWHWCANCPNYPTGSDLITRHSEPEYGEICSECKVLERAGDCRKDSFFSARK
jgi:hypothetical protein